MFFSYASLPRPTAKMHLVFGQLKWVALIAANLKSSSHLTHCCWKSSWGDIQETILQRKEVEKVKKNTKISAKEWII